MAKTGFSSVLAALIFCIFSIQALQAKSSPQKSEYFKIAPYLILNNEREAVLSYYPEKGNKLTLNVYVNNKQIISKATETTGLQKINLGKVQCSDSLKYRIDLTATKTLVAHEVYPIHCEEQELNTIGFMSDTQVKNKNTLLKSKELASLVAEVKKTTPMNLIINAGDIVHHGGVEQEWVDFFNIGSKYLGDSYLVSAAGNHEYYDTDTVNSAPENFMMFMRDINDPSLGQLSINYRDAQILILNTNFKQLDDFFIRQQWQWLESKLAEAQQNNKISFIVSHHSAFSSSLEHYRSIPRRLRKEFIPILDKFSHQMVVLSGHLHMYERSFRNGVHYIIAGPSGGMFNPPTNINPHMKVLKPFVSTFTTLTFGKGQVIIKTINQKREVIDQLVIKRK